MGGCSIDDDQDFISALTLVLVGRTGNGKSATGNSIIRSKNFVSKRSSSGVTTTSKVATTTLADGRMLNVIDTPGLFDPSVDPKLTRKEIISCIDMAKDGIHAVLVVFSVCGRFSEEENAVISSLVTLFGDKVYDYMIVVFTGGDELEDNGITLEGFLSNSSETLKKILSSCGNRYVLFNNRTENQNKKAKQLQQLLYYVSMVLEKNGRALTNDIITEPKKGNMEQAKRVLALKEPEQYTKQEMLELKKQITKMVGVVDSPDRAALTEAWKSWMEEHIEATGKVPPGNEKGNTTWVRQAPKTKADIRLTPRPNTKLTVPLEELIDRMVKENKVVAFIRGLGLRHNVVSHKGLLEFWRQKAWIMRVWMCWMKNITVDYVRPLRGIVIGLPSHKCL